MPKSHEKFVPWVERYLRPRYPELVAPLMAAVDAFDAIQDRGELSQGNLGILVEAACSSRRPLYENVCGFMAHLTARWPEATAAILQMSKSPKAQIRFNAILCLGRDTPSDVVDAILKGGLRDKSARVRSKAADWAGRLRNKRLVTELGAALTAEKNRRARSTIEFELRLLRDGYILEKTEDGWFRVTVHTDSGGTRGGTVAESRLKLEGVETIAAELRRG
jgi:hypothetical protein